ncbi:ABC transporter permease [Parasphaerochaeta coccoides]|uniref:Autoinducer 2 import system permease protein LsrD n=1 Tax=Parasphaerochaeta coccoides (strain ATCC BAA-1237 / DSM 17374 / SPN1) TaxID=760011 RepID=F4GKH1_PARC1|nr:ABC transporter permease [Parasphaerochaeta coccoides]AEC02854.1 inner-membrane translocator [Parasphaerochaeta coccoides DSM 17374]
MSTNEKELVARSRLVDESGLKEQLIRIFTQWEVLLGIIFILMVLFFTGRTPYFLDWFNLMNASFQFSEKAIMALPMVFIIMCGDIDISVASIIALCGFLMGMVADAGGSTVQIIVVGLATGTVAGLINGLLITGFRMPAIAVTLATQAIYRGIAKAIMTEHAFTRYPEGFGYFGQGYIPGTVIPFQLVLYLVLALIMGFILHRTMFGWNLYAIGNSQEAARFSGINVQKARVINYMLMGFFTGIASILLLSRILSARSNIATGYDMEVITLVVLGGVSINGGKGNMGGVVIAAFLVGYLKFGMGLLKLSSTVMSIVTGGLLIVAVLLPRLLDVYKQNRKLRMQQKSMVSATHGHEVEHGKGE